MVEYNVISIMEYNVLLGDAHTKTQKTIGVFAFFLQMQQIFFQFSTFQTRAGFNYNAPYVLFPTSQLQIPLHVMKNTLKRSESFSLSSSVGSAPSPFC